MTVARRPPIGSAFFLDAAVSVITNILPARVSVRCTILAVGVMWTVMQFPISLGDGAAIRLVTRFVISGAARGTPAPAMSLASATITRVVLLFGGRRSILFFRPEFLGRAAQTHHRRGRNPPD
ncbi:hypothetical protein [Rhodococcus sp. USK13]|uniref:hypothetical protein n=1 Tax=Rhodococcus sp. USK13 TaxID=2806442 RepID=UPI001BCD7516|nr:hypothetical protein [Rhodococcus sp. USK13]